MTWLILLSFVGALALGIWIGRPRPYDRPLDEIDRRLDEEGEHQTVKRRKTVVDYLHRKLDTSSRRSRSNRKPFRMH